LLTNSGQLALRLVLVALLLNRLQATAIPVALVISAGLEALILLGLVLRRLHYLESTSRVAASVGPSVD
jgi:hypothetical protein